MGCEVSEPVPETVISVEKSSQLLEDQRWNLISFGSTSIAVPKKAYILFKEGRYRGYAACNGIGGKYLLEDAMLSLKAGFSTRMACPELDLEHHYVNRLRRINSYVIKGDILDLRSEGQSLLQFQAQ